LPGSGACGLFVNGAHHLKNKAWRPSCALLAILKYVGQYIVRHKFELLHLGYKLRVRFVPAVKCLATVLAAQASFLRYGVFSGHNTMLAIKRLRRR